MAEHAAEIEGGALLPGAGSGRRILLVVAAPREAEAVVRAIAGPGARIPEPWRAATMGDRFDLVVSGVGKANAAAATALSLDVNRHAGVLSVGVAGALPGSGLSVGDALCASRSVYADEGLETPEGFRTCAEMGFPLGPFGEGGVAPSSAWLEAIRPAVERVGPVATVSTCSGTDARASSVRERTGADAEAMEGAAVGHVAARIDPGLRFAEVRVISNTTGDRGRQRWDLGPALSRLASVIGRL